MLFDFVFLVEFPTDLKLIVISIKTGNVKLSTLFFELEIVLYRAYAVEFDTNFDHFAVLMENGT